MEAFSIRLSDGNTLTGAHCFPTTTAMPAPCAKPLVVAIHGGTYSSSYFNADKTHSIMHVAQALGIPVIAIDRPGYQGSSPLPDIPSDSSYIQQQGAHLHQTILPSLWKQHASALGVSSIFVYGHSIGGAIVVVSASLHGSSPQDALYPLCGISISGCGSNVTKLPLPQFDMDPQDMKSQSLRFPSEQKDALMLGPPKCHDRAILQQTERLQHDISVLELYDINVLWASYWRKYTAEVHVPVTYTLGEHEGLWNATDQDVKEFASSFVKARTVEARMLLSAPHCIELSLQAPGLVVCTFGFAIASATSLKLGS